MENPGQGPMAASLRATLRAPLEDDPEYWTFTADSRRTMGHALLNYPAMMVPQVQGALLDAWMTHDPQHQIVLDPFAGSGTVMGECMVRGLDFRGFDINPLALLLLHVKSRPYTKTTLDLALSQVLRGAQSDRREDSLDFRGRKKWFTDQTAVQLTRLHRAIRKLGSQDLRRFFWLSLAATVRQVSNSRTSTFKLHVYPAATLAGRRCDAIAEFERLTSANIAEASAQRDELASASLLSGNGRYTGETRFRLADVRSIGRAPAVKADLLMTSPPYGDNRTTVPYGQFAFLPLQWIDPADLDGGENLASLIETPYRTDVASLGGKVRDDTWTHLSELAASSDAVRDTQKHLKDMPGDGLRRFAAFICDLDKAMGCINRQLRPGAFQFWTLGERSIAGHRIPTTRIVTDLAVLRGCAEVATLARTIPNGRKRMAIRNDTVSTIRAESILVLQGATTTAYNVPQESSP